MASEEFQRTSQRSRELLDWENASGAARKWWEQLESINEDRLDLVIKLTAELLEREATIDDFFLACSYSGREGVRENLIYLDLIRQDKDIIDSQKLEIEKSINSEPVRTHRYRYCH